MRDAATAPPPVIVTSGGGNPLLMALIVLGGGAGVYFFGVKPWLDKKAAKEGLNKDQGSTITPAKGHKLLYDLNGKLIKSANLGTIAAELHDSLDAMFVDGPRVVRVFKSTPFGHVAELEKFYLDRYSESLRQRMVEKMKDKDWINVKFWFK